MTAASTLDSRIASPAEDPRGLPGDLRLTPGGWSFERDGRHYSLSGLPWVLDVWAVVSGHQFWRTIDPRIAIAREDFAAQVAPHNQALQAEVRRDLNVARMRIQLQMAELEVDAEIDRLEAEMEQFFSDAGGKAEESVELLVLGLRPAAAGRVSRLARRLGAKVKRRSYARARC